MLLLQSKTARLLIYLTCVGGLLVFNSVLVTFLWNSVLAESLGRKVLLSFLEGAGITAFAYVIAFSIRYASKIRSISPLSAHQTNQFTSGSVSISIIAPKPLSNQPTDVSSSCEPPLTSQDPQSVARSQEHCAQMTPQQKEALKHELLTQCGCTDKHVR